MEICNMVGTMTTRSMRRGTLAIYAATWLINCNFNLHAQNLWEQSNGLLRVPTTAVAFNKDGDIFVCTTRGVFRSTDNGNLWQSINNGLTATNDLTTLFTNCLAINANGQIFLGTARGLFQSQDNGENWTKIDFGLESISQNILALAINAAGRIFLGSNGMYHSPNNGKTWVPSNIPNGVQISSIAINSKGHVFAGSFTEGLFGSMDDGNSWSPINTGLVRKEVRAVAISLSDDILIGTASDGIYKSSDVGENWAPANTGLLDDGISALASSAEGYFYATNEGLRVYRSMNNGESWTPSIVGGNSSGGRTLAVDAKGNVYFGTGGSQYFRGGLFRSSDHAQHWESINTGFNIPEVRSLITDNDGHIFAGTAAPYYGAGTFISSDGGKNWEKVVIDSVYESTLALARDANGYVYSGVFQSGVFRTIDHGATWIKLNLGLNYPEILSLTVNSRGNIFVGTSTGLFRSIESNGAWTTINISLPKGYPRTIAINSNDHVFVGVDYYGEAIFRSTDNGESWEAVNDGINTPNGELVYAITITDDDEIFVGTNQGRVLRSNNNGDAWMAVGNSILDNTPVRTVAIYSRKEIFAGTQAGVYFFPNSASEWRQINDGLTNLDIFALAVDKSDRVIAGTYGGGVFKSILPITAIQEGPKSQPLEYFLAQNYPNPFNPSTIIHFMLKRSANTMLKVYDILGKEIVTLVRERLPVGEHKIEWKAENVASGVYFYQLVTDDFTQTRKMILLR